MTPSAIERAIIEILEGRHPRTACPSEVARSLAAQDRREHMQEVRDAAARLAKRGRIVVLQRGKKVDVKTVRGAIRLRLAAAVEAYRGTDFRKHPERYPIERGEQRVLTAEPYKSELLPLWRFKDEASAKISAKALHAAFIACRRSRFRGHGPAPIDTLRDTRRAMICFC
ncbi:MAG TPA: DUF3253 domain-containing protein [Polyangiaceae bacterium]|nr:DUF3253 domain-containing protein [Polyangiaceae bacterium]